MRNSSEFLQIQRQASNSLGISFKNRKFALLSHQGRLTQLRVQSNYLSEKFFFDICSELSVNFLVECGAFDADISKKFTKELGNSAVAFEANPFVFERFQKTIETKQIEYVNIGLASQPGVLQLNIPSHNPRSWSMQSSFNKTIEFTDFETVSVAVDSLDNLLSGKFEQKSFALWIDVEGFGYSVLEGAAKILRFKGCKILFIEVQDRAYWDNEKNASEICQFLAEFGYVPVIRDSPLAELYNIVFIKATDVGKALRLTNQYWFDATQMRPAFWDAKPFRYYFSLLKKSVLIIGGAKVERTVNKLAAFFGSKSSRDAVN